MVITTSDDSPHQHQQRGASSSTAQHVLRVVDLTTMRAAAASLRAFGGSGEAAAAAELAAATSSSQSDDNNNDLWTSTANAPSDPPLPIPYAAASALQEALAEQLLRSTAAAAATTPTTSTHHHTLLLLQHAPVFTVGKRGRGHGFLSDEHMRAAMDAGAQVDLESPRGGQATFHGLGQAVAYPVVCVRALSLGARRYVEALEDSAVRACGAWGVRAEGRQPAGRTGVWAGGRKVAAVGVRVSLGVATHGLALNVAGGAAASGGKETVGDDGGALLGWFRLIDPCGLGGEVEGEGGDEGDDDADDDGVTTSLWRELGRRGAESSSGGGWPSVRRVASDVAHALASELGVHAVWPDGAAAALDAADRGPPLPPEAARAVLEALACAPAALSARAPVVSVRRKV